MYPMTHRILRMLSFLLLTLLGEVSVQASTRFYISPFVMYAGEPHEVEVVLDNSDHAGLCGFQTTLHLPEGITLLDDGVPFVLSSDRSVSGHTLSFRRQSNGDYKILGGGGGQPYCGQSGTALLRFRVQADAPMSGAISLRATTFTDCNLAAYTLPDEEALVRCVEHTYSLNVFSTLRDDGVTSDVSVILNNCERQYAGLEMRVTLPSGFTLVEPSDGSAFILNASRAQGHDLSYRRQSDGSYKLLGGGSGQPYLGDTGTEIFHFTVRGTTICTDVITFSHVTFTDTALEAYDLDDATCSVSVDNAFQPQEGKQYVIRDSQSDYYIVLAVGNDSSGMIMENATFASLGVVGTPFTFTPSGEGYVLSTADGRYLGSTEGYRDWNVQTETPTVWSIVDYKKSIGLCMIYKDSSSGLGLDNHTIGSGVYTNKRQKSWYIEEYVAPAEVHAVTVTIDDTEYTMIEDGEGGYVATAFVVRDQCYTATVNYDGVEYSDVFACRDPYYNGKATIRFKNGVITFEGDAIYLVRTIGDLVGTIDAAIRGIDGKTLDDVNATIDALLKY